MTILVVSFDGYKDLWPAFFTVFNKNWSDCPYCIKLVSNHKTFEGKDVITTGSEINWTQRTLKALKQVETDYILLLLEDYFIGEKVNTQKVDAILSFAKSNNADYIRFTNVPKSRFADGKEIFNLYADEEYAINLQASLWKKDFLIGSLEKYQGNAWQFEIGFLADAVNKEHKIMDGCYAIEHDPLYIHNGVLKGKWFPKELHYFKKQGIIFDWQERGKLSFFQAIKYELSMVIKNILSYETRKKLKRVLQKLGMHFVSDL